MADNQSRIPSTVAPSESASFSGSKKSKPGKAERAARRAATGSEAGQSASAHKASMFASTFVAPKPQPGKFPIVFQSGAGEPSRDEIFGIDHDVLSNVLEELPPRFRENMKYAEFLSYSEYDDDDFFSQMKSAALLRLAQQVVHAHVNMSLPQGDFAPVASTEVRVPASVAAYLSQYGEFAVPALGTRFLLRDYASTVKSLIFAADKVMTEADGAAVLSRSWLPVKQADGRTKHVIAGRLNAFLQNAEIQYSAAELEKAVLSGDPPASWEDLKGLWNGSVAKKNRFDFLFQSYKTDTEFFSAFTTAEAQAVLNELSLVWGSPSPGHLDWTFNPKEAYTRLSDDWARKSATYAQFFELASSQANRAAATGSQSQLAQVSTNDSITVVKTRLALSAPEFSLAACFPASALFSHSITRNVVLTTPLSVSQRATEFTQMDWR